MRAHVLILAAVAVGGWSATAVAQAQPAVGAVPSPVSTPPRTPNNLWPSGAEWKRAGGRALRDPGTWLPAFGAAVIAIGGWDRQISNWAARETPVFGSQRAALAGSDDLRLASHVVLLGSVFLAKEDSGSYWASKAKRLVWQHVGSFTASLVSLALKASTRRLRPDGSERLSFPSGHSTRAFANSAAIVRNLSDAKLGTVVRLGGDAGAEFIAVGTAWARVEAGLHYPTDVLVGAAVGNFVSTVFCELLRGRRTVPVGVEPGGVALNVSPGEVRVQFMVR
jgi:membrane-associated phospholipid phosphatase